MKSRRRSFSNQSIVLWRLPLGANRLILVINTSISTDNWSHDCSLALNSWKQIPQDSHLRVAPLPFCKKAKLTKKISKAKTVASSLTMLYRCGEAYLAVGEVVQMDFIRLSGEQVGNNKWLDSARLVFSIAHSTTLWRLVCCISLNPWYHGCEATVPRKHRGRGNVWRHFASVSSLPRNARVPGGCV